MKKILLVFLSIAICLVGIWAKKKNSSYQLDLTKSGIIWEGREISGGSHTGTLKFKSGKVQKKKNSFEGKLVVDMNSIKCTDIEDPKYNKKLVDHLISEDFFYIKKYKTAVLKVNKTVGDDNDYVIQGDITIRGKTKKIKFPVKVNFSGTGSFEVEGKIKLDRTKFDVRYNSGKFFKKLGDKLIYDDFTIKFKVYFNAA